MVIYDNVCYLSLNSEGLFLFNTGLGEPGSTPYSSVSENIIVAKPGYLS
jgi:hypothetical protein